MKFIIKNLYQKKYFQANYYKQLKYHYQMLLKNKYLNQECKKKIKRS